MREAFVPRAKLVVRDIGIDARFFHVFIIGAIRESGVGSNDDIRVKNIRMDTHTLIAFLNAIENGP